MSRATKIYIVGAVATMIAFAVSIAMAAQQPYFPTLTFGVGAVATMIAFAVSMSRATKIYIVGAVATMIAFAVSIAMAAQQPYFPTLTFGGTLTGSTASVSVSVYADTHIDQSLGLTASEFFSHGPITEWSLQVVAIGTNPAWVVDLELSNDDATWTRILRHDKTVNGSGQMVWARHHKAKRARLTLVRVSDGIRICATGYGESGGCP